MSKIFNSAAEALADKTITGRKVVKGTYAEAFKLVGQPTKDVNGNEAYFCPPATDAHQIVGMGLFGKSLTPEFYKSANVIWHCSVSAPIAGVLEEAELIRSTHPERF